MRRERTHLQHEAEILNQKMTQELLTLKDELKGMFDDRKMGVRSEQRGMESKVRSQFTSTSLLFHSPHGPASLFKIPKFHVHTP